MIPVSVVFWVELFDPHFMTLKEQRWLQSGTIYICHQSLKTLLTFMKLGRKVFNSLANIKENSFNDVILYIECFFGLENF